MPQERLSGFSVLSMVNEIARSIYINEIIKLLDITMQQDYKSFKSKKAILKLLEFLTIIF